MGGMGRHARSLRVTQPRSCLPAEPDGLARLAERGGRTGSLASTCRASAVNRGAIRFAGRVLTGTAGRQDPARRCG